VIFVTVSGDKETGFSRVFAAGAWGYGAWKTRSAFGRYAPSFLDRINKIDRIDRIFKRHNSPKVEILLILKILLILSKKQGPIRRTQAMASPTAYHRAPAPSPIILS
jgi:hypothetical protein